MATPTLTPQPPLDVAAISSHLDDERRESNRLADVREAVFGAQDGLISTLAIVTTVGAATQKAAPVLLAGLASALAGVFAMGVGEYVSSKSEREIFTARIRREEHEVDDRPAEAELEVALLLEREGLGSDPARRIAREIASDRNVLLRTMVEKELGIVVDQQGGLVRGAVTMAICFGLASLIPLIPYLLAPVAIAIWISIVVAAMTLFVMGWVKSRWTDVHWLRSSVETLALGTVAALAGYLFGTVLPNFLGLAGFTV